MRPLVVIALASAMASSAASTVDAAGPQPQWTLFAPTASNNTYLIDLNGIVRHQWPSAYRPGLSVYLLDDGGLLRTGNETSVGGFQGGGRGGRIQRLDWNGAVQWTYLLADANTCQHHDVLPMPNGNVIAIVWEKKTQAEAVAAGRNPATIAAGEVWSEKLVEIQPNGANGGTIVWQWHVWDHLVQNFDATKPNFAPPSSRPERINVNYTAGSNQADWLHMNGLDYNAALDQIIVSLHNTGEVWIISHAPGASGDLLYRWGNPAAYGLGTTADRKLFGQHNAHWIPQGLSGAGDILLYNNGLNRPAGAYSSIEQFRPPLAGNGSYTRTAGQAFGPTSTVWTCDAIDGVRFYSSNISGAQRMANGNTLICVGASGRFVEVDSTFHNVWQYNNTFGGANVGTFRATRIEARDPRLDGLLWCVADVDNGAGGGVPDGGVGIEDLLFYLDLYDAGVFGADVDDGNGGGVHDGGVGIEDLLFYLFRYDSGC